MLVRSLMNRAAAALAGLALTFAAVSFPARAEPAMWVVKDADSTLYLLGTIHVLRPDTVWRTPKIDAALSDADELWLEVPDISSVMAQLMGGIYTLRYGLSPSKPLSKRLSPEDFEALDRAARQVGFTAKSLDMFRPWLAAMMIQAGAMASSGYDATAGVEMRLLDANKTHRMPVRGFETIELQMQIFGKLPEKEEIAFLLSTLAENDAGAEAIDTLASMWEAGDTEGLEELIIAEMKNSSPGLYDALIANRNASWAVQIEEMLKGSGTVFIAVGAGHLIGPDSVQALLAKRGVAATRY